MRRNTTEEYGSGKVSGDVRESDFGTFSNYKSVPKNHSDLTGRDDGNVVSGKKYEGGYEMSFSVDRNVFFGHNFFDDESASVALTPPTSHFKTLVFLRFLAIAVLVAAALVLVALLLKATLLPGAIAGVVVGLSALAYNAIFGSAIAAGALAFASTVLLYLAREEPGALYLVREEPVAKKLFTRNGGHNGTEARVLHSDDKKESPNAKHGLFSDQDSSHEFKKDAQSESDAEHSDDDNDANSYLEDGATAGGHKNSQTPFGV